MADPVTVKAVLKDYVHNPNMEVVLITASEGEEYRSTKFNAIIGALVTNNEDVDSYVNVTYSGQVATIHSSSGTPDIDMCLVLFGRK